MIDLGKRNDSVKEKLDNNYFTLNIDSSTNDNLKESLLSLPEYIKYREIYNNAVSGVEYDFPIHIDVENIYACNLSCIHCARQYVKNQKLQKMETDLYEKLLTEAVKIGTRSLGFAIWGEVFLDKDIFKKIRFAKNSGIIDIRLHSNGLLIDENVADKIVQSGVSFISISLDAVTEAVYNKMRGGNFNKAVFAIGNIINAKLFNNSLTPELRVSFVKTNINENEAEMFSKIFGQYCDVAIQEFYDPISSLPDLNPKNKMFQNKVKCFENFFKVFVRYNGDVVPCCEDINSNITFGNVKTDTLYNIYNSSLSKNFRRQHKEGMIKNKHCRICLGLN